VVMSNSELFSVEYCGFGGGEGVWLLELASVAAQHESHFGVWVYCVLEIGLEFGSSPLFFQGEEELKLAGEGIACSVLSKGKLILKEERVQSLDDIVRLAYMIIVLLGWNQDGVSL
jgi:hypothetical protein